MEITYLGKKLKSDYWDGNIIQAEVDEIRQNYYTENKELALKQLKAILLDGKSSFFNIHRYYFERIANDGKKHNTKWSINEFLASDELVQTYANKTKYNRKLFRESEDLTRRFRKALSLGGSTNIGVLTTFPIKQCVERIQEHLPEGGKVYIDPCCGWGSRMIASAVLDLEYIGFDVNKELIPKLHELGKDIQTFKPDFSFKLYEQGSQYYVPELVNQADIIFTSPPYFNLELYPDNSLELEDSVHGDYELWVTKFVNPLMENLMKYAKKGTKVMINIKDFNEYPMVDDFIKAGKQVGLTFEDLYELKTVKRTTNDGNLIKNDEPIITFIKE